MIISTVTWNENQKLVWVVHNNNNNNINISEKHGHYKTCRLVNIATCCMCSVEKFWRDCGKSTRCFGGISKLLKGWLRWLCKLASMSAVLLLVLVLLSTLGQAPHELKYSCPSKGIAVPCLDTVPPRTTTPPSQTGQHSLISSVSIHSHVSLLFLDPVQPWSSAEVV